jgi:hypothetical protein
MQRDRVADRVVKALEIGDELRVDAGQAGPRFRDQGAAAASRLLVAQRRKQVGAGLFRPFGARLDQGRRPSRSRPTRPGA